MARRNPLPDEPEFCRNRGWLNTAIAFARILPDLDGRTLLTAVQLNGLALVDFRERRFDDAIQLETEAMALLDSEPAPGVYEAHLRRALLSFNRAQLYNAVGPIRRRGRRSDRGDRAVPRGM